MATKTDTMYPDSFAKAAGMITGVVVYLFNLNISDLILDATTFWAAMGSVIIQAIKVTIYGALGAAGGLAGKKYLFPFAERVWTWVQMKFQNKKPKL